MSGLKGKTAIVTGGGRGIGAAIARSLSEAGIRVVVTARTQTQIDAVADELTLAGGQCLAIGCDVTDEAAVASLVARTEEEFGSVDILINNAGVAPSAPLKRITLAQWEQTMAVNVRGTFLCTRAVIPKMTERGWGRVINIASIAAHQGASYIADYAASKHAVLGFTRSVAQEVATRGVTVNAVCPGYVRTDMIEVALDRIAEKTGRPREEGMAHFNGLSPQGRVFETEEVAFLVLTLCDPRARGINGQGIVLDGGGVQA